MDVGELKQIMDMSASGAGCLNTAPGQVSGCGEMTMCLLRALVESNSKHFIN